MEDEQEPFQCKECGLHYEDKATAEKCAGWCREHMSCNLDITKHSIESQQINQ
jgi:hypothetical protein